MTTEPDDLDAAGPLAGLRQRLLSEEYRRDVFEEMAEPSHLRIVECNSCGRRFAYRSWPMDSTGMTPDLQAMLDGLHQAWHATGGEVYGFAFIDRTRQIERIDKVPVQIWRASDGLLLANGDDCQAALTELLTLTDPCANPTGPGADLREVDPALAGEVAALSDRIGWRYYPDTRLTHPREH